MIKRLVALIAACIVFSTSCAPVFAVETITVNGILGNNLNATTTTYGNMNGARIPSTTQNARESIFPQSGTVSNLRFEVLTAPDTGAGTQSWTMTVEIGSADSTATCTFSEATKNCSDITHFPTFTAGQRAGVKITPSASAPTVTRGYWSIQVHTNVLGMPNRELLFFSGTSTGTLSTTVKNYVGPQGAGSLSTTETARRIVFLTAGTVKSLYADIVTAPDTGVGTQSFTFTVNKNGVATTVTFTISEANTSGNSGSNSFTVAANDYISLETDPAGTTPAATIASFGLVYEPDLNGEVVFPFSDGTALPTAAATVYFVFTGDNGTSNGTETNRQQLIQASTLQTFTVFLSGAPDNGVGTQSYTFTVRLNAATSTALACTASEAQTGCTVSANVALSDDDNIAVSILPAGTPTARTVSWTINGFIQPRRQW